ncbi:hypothetical protein [Shewanella woodyi]|uniref:hypothetical protein n=1 Tax=Shewanella woodyi TaxID=60961 RepID=UPI00374A0CDE
MSDFSNRFGNKFLSSNGYILEKGIDTSPLHLFGGSSWKVIDDEPYEGGPILLFVLDLKDPKLSSFAFEGLDEFPIVSYLNCDAWLAEQTYQIKPEEKTIYLKSKGKEVGYILPDEDKLPNPLPEVELSLRNMSNSEYPIDENSYWKNTDDFLGGESFVRVAGMPLWLQEPRDIKCSCGKEMVYVMGLGYEGWNEPFKLLSDEPFCFGEGALYAFYCSECFELKVISQTS